MPEKELAEEDTPKQRLRIGLPADWVTPRGEEIQPRVEANNPDYRPGGGDRKIFHERVNVQADSKIRSLDNQDYNPGGGDKPIFKERVDFESQARAKIGSLENAEYKPGGGDKQIFNDQLDFTERAAPKVGSLDNKDYEPRPPGIKVYHERLPWLEHESNRPRLRGHSEDSGGGGGDYEARRDYARKMDSQAQQHQSRQPQQQPSQRPQKRAASSGDQRAAALRQRQREFARRTAAEAAAKPTAAAPAAKARRLPNERDPKPKNAAAEAAAAERQRRLNELAEEQKRREQKLQKQKQQQEQQKQQQQQKNERQQQQQQQQQPGNNKAGSAGQKASGGNSQGAQGAGKKEAQTGAKSSGGGNASESMARNKQPQKQKQQKQNTEQQQQKPQSQKQQREPDEWEYARHEYDRPAQPQQQQQKKKKQQKQGDEQEDAAAAAEEVPPLELSEAASGVGNRGAKDLYKTEGYAKRFELAPAAATNRSLMLQPLQSYRHDWHEDADVKIRLDGDGRLVLKSNRKVPTRLPRVAESDPPAPATYVSSISKKERLLYDPKPKRVTGEDLGHLLPRLENLLDTPAAPKKHYSQYSVDRKQPEREKGYGETMKRQRDRHGYSVNAPEGERVVLMSSDDYNNQFYSEVRVGDSDAPRAGPDGQGYARNFEGQQQRQQQQLQQPEPDELSDQLMLQPSEQLPHYRADDSDLRGVGLGSSSLDYEDSELQQHKRQKQKQRFVSWKPGQVLYATGAAEGPGAAYSERLQKKQRKQQQQQQRGGEGFTGLHEQRKSWYRDYNQRMLAREGNVEKVSERDLMHTTYELY